MKYIKVIFFVILCVVLPSKYKIVHLYSCNDTAFEHYLTQIMTQCDSSYYSLEFVDVNASRFYLQFIEEQNAYPVILFGTSEKYSFNIESIWGMSVISGKHIYLSGEKSQKLFNERKKCVKVIQGNNLCYPDGVDDAYNMAFLVKDDRVHLIDFCNSTSIPLE